MSIFKTLALGLFLSVPMLAGATSLAFNPISGGNAGTGFGNMSVGTTSTDYVLNLGSAFTDSFNLIVGAGESASVVFNTVNIGSFLKITDLQGYEISPVFTSGLSFSGLGAGNYGFLITGTGTGSIGGQYSIATAVSAVPVPAAVWFMGSAMVGLFSFRKRKMALAA